MLDDAGADLVLEELTAVDVEVAALGEDGAAESLGGVAGERGAGYGADRVDDEAQGSARAVGAGSVAADEEGIAELEGRELGAHAAPQARVGGLRSRGDVEVDEGHVVDRLGGPNNKLASLKCG